MLFYRTRKVFLLLFILVAIVLLAGVLAAQPVQSETAGIATDRTGAWVDTIHVSAIPAPDEAFNALAAGNLHLYMDDSGGAQLYEQVRSNPDVTAYVGPSGLYDEITLNPAGPVFGGTGKLNPFAVPEIRAAVNQLIDRSELVDGPYEGLAIPRYTALAPALPEYVRYFDLMQTIESEYAYNFQAANAAISAQMNALGATRSGGIWHYNGEPVTLIFYIRNEDVRVPMGDYIADQLERVGFIVERNFVTSAQASPIVYSGDPDDGQWHLYTGAWSMTRLNMDEGTNFRFFFTPDGFPVPLWQAYDPSPALLEAANRLYYHDYTSEAERASLMETALTLSMEDSVHIFVANRQTFTMRRAGVTAAHSQLDGLLRSELWPYTIRFVEQEGGVMSISQATQLLEPWNPVSGSNWIFDAVLMRATNDKGLLRNPISGLNMPQRIISATVTAQSDLPIRQTDDWVTLNFTPTVEVPDDAWVDWDAGSQTWITAAEKYGDTQTALIKSVVQYPVDLFDTITWHDGSPLSLADFIMPMIMRFDMADPLSEIYDSSMVSAHQNFMAAFKGFRITATSPLTIEYYTDLMNPDAEDNVYSLWPGYGQGEIEAPWHTVAVGYMADRDGLVAFSRDKANAQQIPWMDFLGGGGGFSTLASYVDTGRAIDFVPYSATLQNYVTPVDAATRWDNLYQWLSDHNNLWVGTGPFYLDTASIADSSLTLQRYPGFPDSADKWVQFNDDPSPATLTVNHVTGAPGSYFNVTGSGYPVNRTATISVNGVVLGTALIGADGGFEATLQTSSDSEEGAYLVTVSVNPSATTRFHLDATAPVRAQEGTLPTFLVPEDIAFTDFIHLPVFAR